MPPKITLSTQMLNKAMQSPKVRKALEAKAQRVLPRAKAIALADGQKAFAQALKVTEGTRPGLRSPIGFKRPYARVGASVTPEIKKADGYKGLTRSQVLRRASDG